jgi:hypothetical protein
MQSVSTSIGNLPFSISMSFLENISLDWSFYKMTRIFLLKCNILTCFHKLEDFNYALSTSACIEHGTTWNVWRKSPDNKIIATSNCFWLFRKYFKVLSKASKDLFMHHREFIPHY